MLFLGIDGGQSHIEVAIYINRKLIFNNTGGPTHIQGRSMEATFTEALQEALVGLPKSKLESIKAIGVGVSGFHIKGKKEAVIHSINSIFPDAKVYVVSDSEVALWGATEGKDGATVVAGTGSIAYGQYKQTTKMIGGYGFIFSEASGFWIGKEAIRLSLLSKDGREEETDLLPLVKNHFNVNNIKEVPSIIFSKESVDVAKIASLAKGVIHLSNKNDPVALKIIHLAAKDLADLTTSLLKSLHLPKEEQFTIYRIGGLWKSDSKLISESEHIIKKRFPNIKWSKPLFGPAIGASIMAKSIYKKDLL